MIKLSRYRVGVVAIQAFVFSVPLGVHVFQPQTHFLFPPLGDASGLLSTVGSAIIGVFAILPWMFPKNIIQPTCVFTVLSALALCLWYATLVQRFVVGVPVLSQDKTIYLSIGSERSRNADLFFPGLTDREMLTERGLREEEVRWLYTDDSIDRVRDELFISYIGMLVCINLTIGLLSMRKLEADAFGTHTPHEIGISD